MSVCLLVCLITVPLNFHLCPHIPSFRATSTLKINISIDLWSVILFYNLQLNCTKLFFCVCDCKPRASSGWPWQGKVGINILHQYNHHCRKSNCNDCSFWHIMWNLFVSVMDQLVLQGFMTKLISACLYPCCFIVLLLIFTHCCDLATKNHSLSSTVKSIF